MAAAGLTAFRTARPKEAPSSSSALAGKLPEGWEAKLPVFTPKDGDMATRDAGGKVLERPGGRRAEPDRRLGRPQSVDEDVAQGNGRFRESDGLQSHGRSRQAGNLRRSMELRRPQYPFRHPRACDDGHRYGPGVAWRRAALLLYIYDIFGLHAAGNPPGGFERGQGRFTFGLTTASRLARMDRHTNLSNNWQVCVPSRTFDAFCGRRTRPKRPRPGASRCSTRGPSAWCSLGRSCRSLTGRRSRQPRGWPRGRMCWRMREARRPR